MMNLIKMNILRMFQMKTLYILFLACMIIAFFFVTVSRNTFTNDVQQQMIEEQTDNIDAGESTAQAGITNNTANEENTLCRIVSVFDGCGFIVILVGFFMSILACSEHSSGFLKNLASCSQHKWQVVVARLVPGFLCVILMQIAFFVSLLLANKIYGSPFPIGNVVSLLPVVGVQILLETAFCAFVLVIAEITRSSLVCNIVSILSGIGFGEFIILSRIQITKMPLNMESLSVTLAVGAITLMVYLGLSGFIFQKRDTY